MKRANSCLPETVLFRIITTGMTQRRRRRCLVKAKLFVL